MSRTLIDPFAVNDIDHSDTEQVDAFALFCAAVPNKPAVPTAEKVNRFLAERPDGITPIQYVRGLVYTGALAEKVRQFKLCPYGRVESAFAGLAAIRKPLRHTGLEDWLPIRGIGNKTARYFLMYGTPYKTWVAVLDVHVLRYMREKLDIDTPRATPSGKLYDELEAKWLDWVEQNGMTPREADTLAWTTYARSKQN